MPEAPFGATVPNGVARPSVRRADPCRSVAVRVSSGEALPLDLVDNVQQGLVTRDYECGPLSAREDAVAWFADRVRADLAPVIGSAG